MRNNKAETVSVNMIHHNVQWYIQFIALNNIVLYYLLNVIWLSITFSLPEIIIDE